MHDVGSRLMTNEELTRPRDGRSSRMVGSLRAQMYLTKFGHTVTPARAMVESCFQRERGGALFIHTLMEAIVGLHVQGRPRQPAQCSRSDTGPMAGWREPGDIVKI